MTGSQDLAGATAGVGELLRHAGVPTSPGQVGRFAAAVALMAPVCLDELYWVARVTLVTDQADLDIFDRVFNQLFRGIDDWAESRGDSSSPPPARTAPDRLRRPPGREEAPGRGGEPSADDGGGGEPAEHEVELAVASREERLAKTDFAQLTDNELTDLRRLMTQIRLAVPLRPARRHRRDRRGDRLDLRATLRRSRRSGGDPIEHITRRARRRPRKLVVLCDISGSMAPYSRACIQLLHAAAGGSDAEVFTFATRLTRLTRALSVADPDAALEMAATGAPDWKGGTRIGTSLKDFLDHHGRRGLARGAVMMIVSDGWDCDEPALLGEQMARLDRLAHRIVWVNPRRTAAGYRPLTGGMATALPFCDAFVGGNTLAALGDAVAALAAGS